MQDLRDEAEGLELTASAVRALALTGAIQFAGTAAVQCWLYQCTCAFETVFSVLKTVLGI